MIFEGILVSAVLAVILLFFYKQAVNEFRISQTETLEKAMPLLQERCPIVVLPAPQPQTLWTRADIQQRPTLASTPVNGKPLKDALTAAAFPLKKTSAETLAEKVGLPVWVKQTLLPIYKDATWWGPLATPRTEVAIGAQGLRQTYAYSTILLATEGALAVSLLNETADPYLPKQWLGKRLRKMTRDDAPLLAQIQYVDVIVRPGSALLIPPHWKVCWETHESKESALAVWTEIHHPVSRFAHHVGTKGL
jgi:hypothetical protein